MIAMEAPASHLRFPLTRSGEPAFYA